MSELFNASTYLLDRHVEVGDGDRVALAGVLGELTYTELWRRVQRAAAGLRELGLQPGNALLGCRLHLRLRLRHGGRRRHGRQW